LKAAAEKATPGRWKYYPGNTSIEYNVDSMDEDQGSIVYVDSGDFTQAQTDRNGEFIALANPANVLALVEALEGRNALVALQKIEIRELNAELEKAQQCIAELESRTVKLPHRNLGHPKLFLLCPFPYYDAEDMDKALAAADIKVEAE
ncbi:TPA: ead/Ea22-like family protein, partial [Klebsiella quasipneumoniae]